MYINYITVVIFHNCVGLPKANPQIHKFDAWSYGCSSRQSRSRDRCEAVDDIPKPVGSNDDDLGGAIGMAGAKWH